MSNSRRRRPRMGKQSKRAPILEPKRSIFSSWGCYTWAVVGIGLTVWLGFIYSVIRELIIDVR